MGFKEEFTREMRNAKNDATKEVEKYWAIDFEGSKIEIHNQMLEETLKVDGQIIDQNVRNSIWSYIVPFSKLSGTFQTLEGKTHKIHVKIGGFVRLNITIKVDGRILLKEAIKLEFLPWSNKELIVPFIEQQIKTHQKFENNDLPDDSFIYDEHHMKLAPGLSDQLVVESVTPFYTKKLIKLFMAQVENPTNQTRKVTYEKVKDEKVISYFHEFVELFSQVEKDDSRVIDEAIWLLDHAAHREVVKFALIVLGCTSADKVKERLEIVALHGEFTGVALFALNNGSRYANEATWEIAKRVTDWGKLEALNFLAPDREEIRQWFLLEGIKNTVPGNASALICAEKGKLDITLHESQITKELFDGAGHLILGLLFEGSHQTLDDYDYAGQVLMRYCYHAKMHCQTFEQFYILTQIQEYMDVPDDIWEERFLENWKPHEKRVLEEVIAELAKNPAWLQEALTILHGDTDENRQALAVALFYGADITELLFEKLKKDTYNLAYYFALFATQDRGVVEQLVAMTNRFETFEQLSQDEQSVLVVLLEELQYYEGLGLPIIEKCLQATDGHLPFFALQTLAEQQKVHWQTPSIEQQIKHLASHSKDSDIRELAKQLAK